MAIWLFAAKELAQHKTDVSTILSENKAHTTNWYATKAKQFQFGYALIPDTDTYDNTGITDEQIEAAKVVKYAAARQARDKSITYIKVATGEGSQKEPLIDAQLTALTAYLNEIADSGVRFLIINAPPDEMKLVIDYYYDPLILDYEGKRLDGTNDTPVQDAVRSYISELEFNGVYTNQGLVDKLQVVDGGVIAELQSASSRYGTYLDFMPINARSVPYAGYYAISDENLIINFISNEEYL